MIMMSEKALLHTPAVDIIQTELERLESGEGFKYFAKSVMLKRFFEGLADPVQPVGEAAEPWSVPIYRITKVPDVKGVNLAKPADGPFVHGVEVNGTFLRATKLDEGLWFTIPGMFLNSQLISFDQAIVEAAQELYKEYIMPVHVKQTISSSKKMVA